MKRFLIFLFITSVTFILAEIWIYEMETISIPTGKAESEIFIYDAPDHLEDAPDEGPTKFQIDEAGNIFILDRKRIKKFDKDGNYIFSTPPTRGSKYQAATRRQGQLPLPWLYFPKPVTGQVLRKRPGSRNVAL